MKGSRAMPVIDTLSDLEAIVAARQRGENLYVRWSRGPERDLTRNGPEGESSRDTLTGVPMSGLSANPLQVEDWWGDRPLRLWVARRLYDYRHLDWEGDAERRPWVLAGREQGRGPDNEALVTCEEAIAWISDRVLHEVDEVVAGEGSHGWGPLQREHGPA